MSQIDELREQLREDIQTRNPWDLYDDITDLGFELLVYNDIRIANMISVARDLVAMPIDELLKQRRHYAELERQELANA